MTETVLYFKKKIKIMENIHFIIGYEKSFQNIDKDWIGFCQYRKFWSLTFTPNNELNINNLQSKVLKEIPNELNQQMWYWEIHFCK